MFYSKACPKCRGDLYQSTDIYGPYIACIQCSHYLTDAEEAQVDHFALGMALQPAAVAQQERVAA